VDLIEIDVDELARLRQEGEVVLIDVRQPHEYEESHVPGAVLIPMAEVPDRTEEMPTDAPIYLICLSGARSGRAAEFWRGEGIQAANIVGGMQAWEAAGFDVATGEQPG
jgi:rhodanese-related sulfurtransferase